MINIRLFSSILTGLILFQIASVTGHPTHRMFATDEGLPSTFIKHINQLPAGHIVISTDDGLSFYDGYEFHDRSLPHGLPHNMTKQTIVDSRNRLIVATDNSVAISELTGDTIPDRFESVPFDPPDGDTKIRAIYETSDGKIYLAAPNLIYKLEEDNQIRKIPFDFEPEYQSDFVRSFSFQEDSEGGILVPSTDNNLLYIPAGEERILRLTDTGLPEQLNYIYPAGDENYWVGGSHGLYTITWDPEQQKVGDAVMIPGSENIDVQNITKVNSRTLLIASNGMGLFKLDTVENRVEHYRDFFSNYIKHIHLDDTENRWVSTDHGVIFIPNMPFGNIGPDDGLPRRYVTGVVNDRHENLWIATHEGLFYRESGSQNLQKLDYLDDEFINKIDYSRENNTIYLFTPHAIHKIDITTLQGEIIREFDPQLNIVNGAVSENRIFWLVNDTGDFLRYGKISDSLTVLTSVHGITQPVSGITITEDDQVWISGTSRYLARNKTGSESFKPIDWEDYEEKPAENSHLNVLYSGHEDYIWIGGSDGVYALNPVDENEEHGFCFQAINDGSARWIRKDNGRMWIGTNRHLHMIEIDDDCEITLTRRFSINNGLVSTSFSYEAVSVDHNGYIWMGTNAGVSYYNGSKVISEASPVRLRYWQTRDETFTTTEKQDLDHDINQITFSFTTFDYPPEDVYFQTRILGFSDEWSEPVNNPNFTPLLHWSGQYTFEIRASRNSSLWTEPLSIPFIIKRPWWFSNIMIVVYVLGFIGIIIGYIRWRSIELRQHNKDLARSIRERTEHLTNTVHKLREEVKQRRQAEEQLKSSNYTKERLIKIISHDLRSPFQGILGYASMLRDQYDEFSDEERREMIGLIINSSNSAVALLNQLLDWVTLQTGKMQFEPEQQPLMDLISNVTGLFQSLANSKSIDLSVRVSDNMSVYADPQMLQSILRNLLSNAIKFTHENSKIVISAKNKGAHSEISITDNGVGMDQETLDKILAKKEAHSTRGTGKESGSGLGLVMTQEMIQRHGGTLTGKSKKGKGTAFTVTLPRL